MARPIIAARRDRPDDGASRVLQRLTAFGDGDTLGAMESEQYAQELTDEDKILLVFGYLGPLALVALVASRREFVKWHAKQGLALSLTWAGIYVVMRWLHTWLGSVFIRPIAEVFLVMAWLVVLGVVLASIVCIVRGLEGERFKIPLIHQFADRL